MSTAEKIAVVGSSEFAAAVAVAVRHDPAHELVAHAGPADSTPAGASLVLCLAEPAERPHVIERALEGGARVATLPFATKSEQVVSLLRSGRVCQVSPLRGFAALETLRRDVRRGALGRRYGLFATHRVEQGLIGVFDEIGTPLLHYALDVLGQLPVRIQTTPAALFGHESDAWFVLLRLPDDTLITVEFAACLPTHDGMGQQLLVEATGTDAVLRAEPTRQTVTIVGPGGRGGERGWWTDLTAGFLRAAVEAADAPNARWEIGLLEVVGAVDRAAASSGPVQIA